MQLSTNSPFLKSTLHCWQPVLIHSVVRSRMHNFGHTQGKRLNFLFHIGQYFILLTRVFRKPERWSVFRGNVMREMMGLGVGSMGIIAIISIFMGAVITLQTASNIDSALIPLYTVGFAARQSMILE